MVGIGSGCNPLYESGVLEKAAGGLMRPGGFALTARALDYCGFPSEANLADVGCGTGLTVEFLRDAYGLNAVGIDSSTVILARGRERNSHLPLLEGSGEQLPLADTTMDGLIVECALSLMPGRLRALTEFHRVLVPGGRLIVTDLYARAEANTDALALPPGSCLAGMTTRENLLGELEDKGFTIELWEDHTPKLTEFVIRMIMEHGSLGPFWACECANGDAQGMQAAMKRSKPGYFLLVAKKI